MTPIDSAPDPLVAAPPLTALFVSCSAWPASDAEAARVVWRLLAPFVQHLGALFFLPFLADEYQLLTAEALEDTMALSSMGSLTPRAWTHRLLLRTERGNGASAGSCRLRLGERTTADAGVALALGELPADLVALESPLHQAAGSGLVQQAWLGPPDWTADDLANFYTFATVGSAQRLPPRARPTALGAGICIRACSAEASEEEVRSAIADVARALTTREDARPAARLHAAPPVVPAPTSSLPTRASPDPYETALIPAIFIASPAVPFTGTTSPEKVAEMFDPVEPQQRPPEPAPDETALVPVQAFIMPKTGTFRDQLGPLVVPVISLDEYAELRARLTVYGESHEPTLQRFGVAAREVHEAIRGRFSEYFLRDPSAQAQFLKAMQAAIGRVRVERDGSER